MPAIGPYGIEQFDAAGVIGAYQQARENRIRSLIFQKQMEREEAEAERQKGVQAAIARYAVPGAVSADTAAGTTTGSPAPASAARGNRQQLFNDLMTIDFDTAVKMADAFGKMDKAQLDQANQRRERIMQIAAGVMQLEPSQRRAALQESAQELQELGFTPEHVANFDPSDQNLRKLILNGMDMERIAQSVKPDFMNVNGEVVDENALARGDKDPVRYRSEFIDTDQGLARRPGAGLPQTLTDADIEALDKGGPTASPSVPFP